MSIQIESCFAVPLAALQLPGVDRDALQALFLERERAGETWRSRKHADTQHGALFESRFDLFGWPEPAVKALAHACHGALSQLVQGLNRYSDDDLSRLKFEYHAWYHITRRGGYQGLHDHPNASWSGIYCVEPGDDVPGRPDSGQVRFHDPRGSTVMYRDPGNENLRPPYFTGTLNLRHEAGRLLLFPSYLRHEIFPYQGERPRIVVAFNCWIRRQREGAS